MNRLWILPLASLLCANSYAVGMAGGETGGGGAYARIDGNIVLADDFYKSPKTPQGVHLKFSDFPKQFDQYLRQAQEVLYSLGIAGGISYQLPISGLDAAHDYDISSIYIPPSHELDSFWDVNVRMNADYVIVKQTDFNQVPCREDDRLIVRV